MTIFQLSRSFGAGDTACRVFPTNTNTKQESVGSQGGEETLCAIMSSVGSCAQSGEKDKDQSRDQQSVPARPVVAEVSEDKLADNGACKGNGGDIALSTRLGILGLVDFLEHSVDRTDNLFSEGQHKARDCR